jgi:hypothetical protein
MLLNFANTFQFWLNSYNNIDPLHEDLQVFLRVDVTGWGIPNKTCVHETKSGIPDYDVTGAIRKYHVFMIHIIFISTPKS